jgi:hypothetical protein
MAEECPIELLAISELPGLTGFQINPLASNKIRTVGDFERLTEKELARLWGVGDLTIKKVRAAIDDERTKREIPSALVPSSNGSENRDTDTNVCLEAARIAGQVYAGCGDAVDAHRMLALMILLEAFIAGGGDHAAEKLGWEVDRKEATVTSLDVVRSLAASGVAPQDV